jgi:replicative DNA helicase
MEKKIIQAAVQNREACHKLSLLLTHEDFSEIGAELFRRINKYYQTDIDAQEVDITLFKSILHEEMPKQADILVQVLDNLEKTSIPNLLQEVTKLKKKALANSIIQSLARDAESMDAVAFMDKYRDLEQIKDEEIQAVSEYAKEVLTELSDTSNLVQIYPGCINDAIDGGVIPGSHILVFARPNVGKTLTVINLGAMMAKDGRKVLHLINEEPKKQILQRYISRLSGRVKRAIFQDIDTAVTLAESRGLKNIFIEDINPGTFHEIRGLIERIKPDVVIIDQLRNIDMRTDSKVEQLEKAATAARNIAKHYDIVVVSVTQAGDSASGKLVLTDSDIDNSKTGIPGQCDLIIGVGCDDTQRRSSMRTMTIVKNKITSVHEYYAVRVQEDLSRIIQV